MSQLTAVDISDSDRFELAEVLKEESESSSAPRPLEDILQETCDDDFDPMSQRSCYELLAAYIARPTATIESKNGHSSCSNCGTGIPYHTRFAAYCLGCEAVFSILSHAADPAAPLHPLGRHTLGRKLIAIPPIESSIRM